MFAQKSYPFIVKTGVEMMMLIIVLVKIVISQRSETEELIVRCCNTIPAPLSISCLSEVK